MSAQDLFIEVGKPGSATTLDANYTAGDTSVAVVSTTNWPPVGKAVIFAIDNVKVVSGEEVQIQGTYNEFEGIVASATSISNVDQKLGSGDRDYAAGSLTRVYVPVSAERENRLAQGMAVEHNQDGTLKDDAATINTLDRTTPYGLLAETRYYTATDTWTKPAGLKFIEVEVQSPGGGGGGADSGAGNSSAGGAGGGGGYSRKKILATALAGTEAVTIGAVGARSGANNSPGNAGGNSSFGSHATTTGGGAGGAGVDTAPGSMPKASAECGAGGTATGGDLNVNGSEGVRGIFYKSSSTMSSAGGGSFLSGGNNAVQVTANLNFDGADGTGYGMGGSGAVSSGASTVSSAGGIGAPGIVIVKEYF